MSSWRAGLAAPRLVLPGEAPPLTLRERDGRTLQLLVSRSGADVVLDTR